MADQNSRAERDRAGSIPPPISAHLASTRMAGVGLATQADKHRQHNQYKHRHRPRNLHQD